MVANPGVLAAGIAAEKLGRPCASMLLQPGLIPSSIAPPVMAGVPLSRNAPRFMWRTFWRALDLVGYTLLGRQLNALRTRHGLRPMYRIFRDWLSPQLVLGMFPAWYAAPQADWPPQIRLAGFPMFDGVVENTLPPEVAEFCSAGKLPLVFTFGTGMMHATDLFTMAVEACQKLDARAIFLTKYPQQIPPNLPATIRHFSFAPFRQLFPHCAAVVHHGGIGTTAKAMAAGLPQLILPFAYDQMDNGTRVKDLGAGDWIRKGKRTPRSMADALLALEGSQIRKRCQELSTRFEKDIALEIAADWVEALSVGALKPHSTTSTVAG